MRHLTKDLPATLGVDDLRARNPSADLSRALRCPVLVLVAGDVGEQIVAGREFRSGARFLYLGSEFDRHRLHRQPSSDVNADYVDLVFYSSVTLFTANRRGGGWSPHCTVPVESGMVLLPKVLPESHLPRLARWFENALRKGAHDSRWLVQRRSGLDCYSELHMHLVVKEDCHAKRARRA